MTSPYTVPKLIKSGTDWYVFIRFYHLGKWHPRKFKEGLNRIKDLKERKRQFEVLAEARHEWLKAGWNPIADPDFKLRKVISKPKDFEMTFNKALDFAMSKKKLAKKSVLDYTNVLKHIKTTATNNGYSDIPIHQFETFHVLELMDRVTVERKLSNHSYNKYVKVLRAMFTVLRRRQLAKYNPASGLEQLRVAESNKYVSLTDEEKGIVTKELFQKHSKFFTFIQMLYHTGIRPKEILALKIPDINLEKKLITIASDIKEENSKTTNVRHVAISNQLMPFLKELQLNKYPSSYYVFGGKKTGPSGAMKNDFFSPSPNHVKRDTVTKLWKTIVINGLKINKHLYALKHTGADDKILAGIELDALRELYGHTSKLMTEGYAKKIREVNRKQIIENAPAFAPIPLRKVG
ncbi:MAG TPA: tyrosine-type recombinase/integrase [Chitinophagaceae bacterium]|nr:tyrosine-type recombinase/integrase [Chitinophagaceae bacterium]